MLHLPCAESPCTRRLQEALTEKTIVNFQSINLLVLHELDMTSPKCDITQMNFGHYGNNF